MSGPICGIYLYPLEGIWGLLFGAFKESAHGILGTEKIHSTISL